MTNMTLTETQLVDRIKTLSPMFGDNAAAAEQQRKPVDAVMNAVEETGAYRYFCAETIWGTRVFVGWFYGNWDDVGW